MSKFNSVQTAPTTSKPKGKFSSDFLKTTNAHSTTIRVLDDLPESSWSHYVPKGHHAFPKANNGKGMSFVCPGKKTCPICQWNDKQKAADPTTKDLLKSRQLWSFNVLDRTLVVTCPKCGIEHYAKDNSFPDECDCGQSLTAVEPAPRNKILILQKGRKLIDQLQVLENDPDFGDLQEYDIKLETHGTGTDITIHCVPKAKQKLDLNKIIGPDWKEKLHNIKEVITPIEPAKAERILNGEDYLDVMELRKKTT